MLSSMQTHATCGSDIFNKTIVELITISYKEYKDSMKSLKGTIKSKTNSLSLYTVSELK